MWSDFYGTDTLSGSPDMYGTPLYNYLLTMGELEEEDDEVGNIIRPLPAGCECQENSDVEGISRGRGSNNNNKKNDSTKYTGSSNENNKNFNDSSGSKTKNTMGPPKVKRKNSNDDTDEDFWFKKMLQRSIGAS